MLLVTPAPDLLFVVGIPVILVLVGALLFVLIWTVWSKIKA